MSQGTRINWNRTPIELGEAAMKYSRGISTTALPNYARKKAAEFEERMKREAPWTDRTGEARQRLRGAVDAQLDRTTIYLISGAKHGKYLELRWGGRYAVVSPMLPRAAFEVAVELKRGMAR